MALDVVAENYIKYPHLEGIPKRFCDRIINQANKEMPILISAPHIDNESYWEAACKKRYKLTRLEQHANSWKNAYIERYIAECLKDFRKSKTLKKLLEECKAARDNCFNLVIDELIGDL